LRIWYDADAGLAMMGRSAGCRRMSAARSAARSAADWYRRTGSLARALSSTVSMSPRRVRSAAL
jgi:hypothetical protein